MYKYIRYDDLPKKTKSAKTIIVLIKILRALIHKNNLIWFNKNGRNKKSTKMLKLNKKMKNIV